MNMNTKTTTPKAQGFTADEKAAMKARALELKLEAKASKNREDGEKALLAAIANMKDSTDRSLAKRIHEIVTTTAPSLMPKTWYGMPAYANEDGKVICFFQAASKFGVRYATFGFQPDAKLDEGNLWATSFAVIQLTESEEAKIIKLVKKAVS
jgi:uncharacterized protein YdhG (YjbR/CyaY superfamily)